MPPGSQDYISTILTAFIVSQTLHSHRAQLVGGLQWLRSPNSPSLRHAVISAIRPTELWRACRKVPALLQLGLLLALFLFDGVHNWALICISLIGPALAILLATSLLDKKLLMFNALVSDEVLAASVVLSTLLGVMTFVVISLAVQSVLESVHLIFVTSVWMREVSSDVASDAAAPFRAVLGQAVELGMAGLEQLRRAEHQWAPVVSHLLEQIGSAANGTTVVVSTFDKLRDCYPQAQWLSQAEDLGKLVLWATARATAATAAGASVNATASWLAGNVTSLGSFTRLNFTHALEEGRKLMREIATELDHPQVGVRTDVCTLERLHSQTPVRRRPFAAPHSPHPILILFGSSAAASQTPPRLPAPSPTHPLAYPPHRSS